MISGHLQDKAIAPKKTRTVQFSGSPLWQIQPRISFGFSWTQGAECMVYKDDISHYSEKTTVMVVITKINGMFHVHPVHPWLKGFLNHGCTGYTWIRTLAWSQWTVARPMTLVAYRARSNPA
jgi:hypothetical protein